VLAFLAPVYLGWSLGANDASNVFGTAVSSRMLRFGTAAALASVFVLLGAVLEGRAGMETLSGLRTFDAGSAVVTSVGAAVAVTLLTILRLPVSTSQAVVGAIVGVGAFQGGVDFRGLTKVITCWILTPFGAMIIAVGFYVLLRPLCNKLAGRLITYDIVLRAALVVVGCYGAYALGANNVANVTGVFVGAGAITPLTAALVGGASIGLGIVTFSKRVMMTVGRGVVRLNAYGALIVGLATAITVHVYAIVGVPVSASQAVVGAVFGVGILKSVSTIRFRAVFGIIVGWLATPVIAALCAMGLIALV